MKILRKIALISLLAGMCLVGYWQGKRLASRGVRNIKTTKMETCLNLYKDYRQDNDQKKLAQELEKIGLTPADFEKIIDRFIYYRTRKSSLEHAFKLLKAFRFGYDFKPAKVVEVSGFASESFRLDAEILAVFEDRPELIQVAFEG
jgi:hypothetical protein